MGFLSKFTGTNRVDLGDGFWVDVRKFLTSEQQDAIDTELIKPTMQIVPDGKGKFRQELVAAMDMAAFGRETAAQAIVAWNLTDTDDAPLPCATVEERRRSLAKIPAPIVRQIADAIGKEDDVDRDTFPGTGEAGTPDGK